MITVCLSVWLLDWDNCLSVTLLDWDNCLSVWLLDWDNCLSVWLLNWYNMVTDQTFNYFQPLLILIHYMPQKGKITQYDVTLMLQKQRLFCLARPVWDPQPQLLHLHNQIALPPSLAPTIKRKSLEITVFRNGNPWFHPCPSQLHTPAVTSMHVISLPT